jgi:hypothetical protein
MKTPPSQWELVGTNLDDRQYAESIERMPVPGGWIYKATYQWWGVEPQNTPPSWAVFVPRPDIKKLSDLVM